MIHYVNKDIKDEELNRYILDKENNPKEVISLPYEILVHKLKFPLQMSIVQEKRISFAEAEVLLLRDLDNPSDYYVKLLTDLLAKNKNQITLFRNTPDGVKQGFFIVGSILFPGTP